MAPCYKGNTRSRETSDCPPRHNISTFTSTLPKCLPHVHNSHNHLGRYLLKKVYNSTTAKICNHISYTKNDFIQTSNL